MISTGNNPRSNLAGLVPSFEFETRLREMNKEYERELEKENEPVLCGKKKNKKAKKSKKNKKKNKKDDVQEEIIHVRQYKILKIMSRSEGRLKRKIKARSEASRQK